jgi:hypothetical protein
MASLDRDRLMRDYAPRLAQAAPGVVSAAVVHPAPPTGQGHARRGPSATSPRTRTWRRRSDLEDDGTPVPPRYPSEDEADKDAKEELGER